MKLYFNPVSGYSQKVLIAFREKGVKFEPALVNLTDPASRAEYLKVYPLGKIPLLVCDDGRMIPESSIIIEYLDTHFDNGTRLIPRDPDLARQTRFHDRMIDLYLVESTGTINFDKWGLAKASPEALERARFRAGVMYDYLEKHLDQKTWLLGDDFSMADCAAATALFYARDALPLGNRANVEAYWKRLEARPSVRPVLDEAKPMLKALLEQLKAAA